jgi:hypothetical protein
VEREAKVDEFVESEDGAEALTEHVDTVGNAFLHSGLSFLLPIHVIKRAIGSGNALHPAEPHAKLRIVRNDFNG